MTGDPYRTLLDVRSQNRPLNAYELLGVEQHEDDDDRIKSAVNSRRSTLLTRKAKASPMIWQRVYQELEKAAATLTNPEKKAAYDDELQRHEKPSGSDILSFKTNGKSNGLSSLSLPSIGQIACRCGGFNPSGRKFCGTCGTPLTEPCLDCGGTTMQGERFCGSCGVNLEDAAARKCQHGEVELAHAAQLVSEGRYQEAESIVRVWTKLESGRVGDLIDRARSMIGDIVTQREQSKSRLDHAIDRGMRAIDKFEWQAAYDALSSIPQLLRTKDHEELLARAKDNLDEVTYLHREIRAAVQAGRTLDLLPKVERLMLLEPHDQRMQQLAVKLRRRHSHDARSEGERLVKAARGKLRDLQYDEALLILEALPEGTAQVEAQPLVEQVREMAYLWQSLRHSPAIDPALVEMAERLHKLAPQDPKIPAILGQLRERLAQPKKRPLAAIPWAKVPEETPLGVPLLRLADFGRINIDAVVTQPLFVENAARLYTACGIALQGLGKAAIDTNLLPNSQTGVINQLSSWMKRPRAASSAWGIDISGSGVKGIRLSLMPKEETVAITAFDIVEHAAPLGDVTGDGARRDLLAESLKKFFERNKVKDEAVCLNLPGTLALGRFFALPPVETKRVDDLMKYEAKQQVPFPLEQLVWDYHIWYTGAGNDKIPRDALLVAAKQHHVQQRLTLLEDAKVRVHLLQSDCIALYNFYQFALGGEDLCVMLLDIGADGTNFIIGDRETLWFRSVPRGGDDFNRAVMRQFEATFATAEQLKRNPAKARHISKLHEAWKPTFGQLLKDARDSLEAFQATERRQPIAAIYALGGSFRTPGLHRHFVGAG